MPKSFDADKAVADFRAVTARIDDPALSVAERKKLIAEAKRIRKTWGDWSGGDDLHQVAYGKPCEN